MPRVNVKGYLRKVQGRRRMVRVRPHRMKVPYRR